MPPVIPSSTSLIESSSAAGRRRADSISSDKCSTERAGAAGATTVSDADFKDTVLYMQQQQALRQAELLSAVQQLLGRAASDSAPPLPASSSAATSRPRADSSSLPLLGADYVAQRHLTEPWAPVPLQQLHDAELVACRSRISQLEQQVQQLQLQLQQRDNCIRRLSEAAVATASTNVRNSLAGSTNNSSASSACVTAPLTPSRLLDQHRECIDAIQNMSSSTFASLTPGSLRRTLERHQQTCKLIGTDLEH